MVGQTEETISGCCFDDIDRAQKILKQRSSKCGGSSKLSKKGSELEEPCADGVSASSSKSPCGKAETANASSSVSNLNQFLNHTTPRVQVQYLPKTCLWDNSVKRWRPADIESVPFFTLGDLWDSFDEWSAYGAGVPLVLNGKEAVIQYYVPYLSALQLYTRSGVRPCLNFRKLGEESDASDCSDYRDSNSEASSDNESDFYSIDGISQLSTPFWKSCQNGFCGSRSGTSLKDYQVSLSSLHESSSDEEDNWEQKGASHLLANYFEDAAPYSRVPLVDKITELARKIPELRTLRSFELLPTSWFSIAWYPIYRIPTGPTLKDLATCFLTFHSLSTPLQGISGGSDVPLRSARLDLVDGSVRRESRSHKLVLQSFGLASYKLRGAFWTAAGSTEKLLASNLERYADSWLKGLHVRHPDFEFFASRSPNRR